jgi:hypothetical protein
MRAGAKFSKVTAGERLRIPAPAYNAFVDAAEAHLNSLEGQTIPNGPRPTRRNDLVDVENLTDSNKDQAEILSIGGPGVYPSLNLNEFQNRVSVFGVLPSSARPDIVILADPVPKNVIGAGWISGICQVKIDFLSDTDTTAGIIDGVSSHLRGGQGSIPIVWKEPGTGIKWALVRLGGGSTEGTAVEHVVVREVFESAGNPTELVLVQAVDRDKTTGVLVEAGPTFNAQAKPGLRSSDYFAWRWPGPIDQRLTRYLPCYKIRGAWRLGWELDVVAEVLEDNVRITDCRPASRAGSK